MISTSASLFSRILRASSVRVFSTRGGAPVFPSISITADSISAQGPFAETQATYLNPDPEAVASLNSLIAEKNLGIVAHFYMDPELQGVLSSLDSPHVTIADSLAMGDAATKMARDGVSSVACLGVDFMSESVRANLDANGFPDVPVYRLSEKKIGCTLAESAEGDHYAAFLEQASKTPKSLHVVYINTSLRTKAYAHSKVPTITCTSSNVVQTVLQAFAQVPDLTVWYGPDTYMGDNLRVMFEHIASLSDAAVRELHPEHTAASIAALLPRFKFFKQGVCAVHHMFGDQVTATVQENYPDAFHTAHFEVPGEMFALAMESREAGRGVVGSTSNILNFIRDKAAEAVARPSGGPHQRLQFVLGTEVGMISSVVLAVQNELRRGGGGNDTTVEVVFPVSTESVTTAESAGASAELSPLGILPGPSSGEGCSAAGGCATCPFMKMNSLDSLMDVVSALPSSVAGELRNEEQLDGRMLQEQFLAQLKPRQYSDVILGRSVSDLGVIPIDNMRYLMQNQKLSDELVKEILGGGEEDVAVLGSLV